MTAKLLTSLLNVRTLQSKFLNRELKFKSFSAATSCRDGSLQLTNDFLKAKLHGLCHETGPIAASHHCKESKYLKHGLKKNSTQKYFFITDFCTGGSAVSFALPGKRYSFSLFELFFGFSVVVFCVKI